MTLQTDHYYSLTCNARIDNLVQPTCPARSPGRWHDAELMEKEAEQIGWAKTPKGHLCPVHAIEAAPAAPASKSSRAKASPHPVEKPVDNQAAPDWSGQ